MSQIISKLEQELLLTSEPTRRAELSARIAGNLARLGQFDDAKRRIGDLRATFGHGQSGRATVWIMLAEGLVAYYGELSPVALDRIERALMLGTAMRYSAFVAIASAWRAHIEFETSKFDAMLRSVRVAISNIEEANLEARTRLSIVLSNSFMVCGDRQSANKWFVRGRECAVKSGDQASIEAMLYNRAAFGLALLRVENCSKPIDVESLRTARMEVESAKNLQALTRLAAMTNLIHLCDANLLVLEKQYELAVQKLAYVRTQVPFAAYNFGQNLIDLEVAHCMFRLGDRDGAATKYAKAAPLQLDAFDVDEQIVALTSMLEMSLADERFGDPRVIESKLQVLREEYSQSRGALLEGLMSLPEQNH